MFREKNTTVLTFVKKVFFSVLIYSLLSSMTFSYVAANGVGNGYDDGENGDDKAESVSVIETKVEIAGGYFLAAYSDCLEFSKLVEMSNINGRDYDQWLKVLDSAIVNIRTARENYRELITTAESTPYNWQVMYRLWLFDYYDYCLRHSLKWEIFWEVESYLAYGHITEVFVRIHNGIDNMEKLLSTLRAQVANKSMPEISYIWRANEKGADILLFSQYIARVFKEI